jgi:UDP-N-acetyl-D-mannosaminuronate dehydrogenase
MNMAHAELPGRVEKGATLVGVTGLGHGGLPPAAMTANRHLPATGYGSDPGKMTRLDAGRSDTGLLTYRMGRMRRAVNRAARRSLAGTRLLRIGVALRWLACDQVAKGLAAWPRRCP